MELYAPDILIVLHIFLFSFDRADKC
jgi:hypothetical protein